MSYRKKWSTPRKIKSQKWKLKGSQIGLCDAPLTNLLKMLEPHEKRYVDACYETANSWSIFEKPFRWLMGIQKEKITVNYKVYTIYK